MKIGIDARCIEWDRGGVARILINMLKIWPTLSDQHSYILYFQHEVPEDDFLRHPFFTCKVIKGPKFLKTKRVLVEQILMPLQLKKDSLDLYFASWYTSPLLYRGVKTIIAAWDISYSTHPKHYSIWNRISLGYFSKKSCKRADGVVTCSIFDAEQIHKYYAISKKKICTIFLAADDRFTPEVNIQKERDIRMKFSLPENFILSLGAIYNRRNVSVIIDAFAKIEEKHPNTGLLIIGKNRTNPKISIIKKIKDLGIEHKVIYRDWFDDEDLPDLYRAADFYICTSTVDGETIMLKEAMKSGTPVITSKLLEGTIGSNGYIIQNPESIDETVDVITNALSNTLDRKILIENGIAWNKQFSWDQVAKETLDFIESR